MPLFEVAVLETAKIVKGEEEKPERLVIPPKYVLAKDDKIAAFKMVMENPELLKGADHDRMQVIVRPFG